MQRRARRSNLVATVGLMLLEERTVACCTCHGDTRITPARRLIARAADGLDLSREMVNPGAVIVDVARTFSGVSGTDRRWCGPLDAIRVRATTAVSTPARSAGLKLSAM